MAKRDEALQRFIGYVRLAAIDRPFISRAEERRLLEDGISRFGLSPDDARGVLLAVAQANDIGVQRDIDRRMMAVLERYGGKRRKISRRKFAEAAAIYRGLSGGTLTEEQARIAVKRVMEENKFRARRAGLLLSRRWYRKIGRRRRAAAADPERPLVERI
ncbi:MAG: hypothetical protein U1E53_10535 [Dongiaceae bacterium]